MSTPRTITLYDERYPLSQPIETAAGEMLRVCVHPVTVATYCRFLNDIGHVENGNGPELVNTVNFDATVVYRGGHWEYAPQNGRRPVTLVTYRGAQLFADSVGLPLMSPEQWSAALAMDGPAARGMSARALNIEDASGGPVDVDQTFQGPSGIRGLLGNVGFWGRAVSTSVAWSFGVGWNKSRLHLRGPGVRRRWTRTTSVSTRIRLLFPAGGEATA
ncbi:SUMF1/EgtB/PvdO family nonheme iron enzyme [Micromonospora marina]|uniref:SUMF1/EgtB/PvdO family nonheme iron enzyme n=1 Tax=Micromonospora marina TaxID=307120 RepID=UPI003D70258E